MPDQEQRSPLTFEQRIEALTSAIEAEARERERASAAFVVRMEALTRSHESLNRSHEALNRSHESLTRRHEALTMNMELAWKDIEVGRGERDKDADNIRRLANIAAAHDQRLSDIEGPRQ